MRAHDTGQAAWHRIRRPGTWGAVLVFGLLWGLGRWVLGFPSRSPEELAGPFLWALLFMVATPMPWQWSGDGAPMARPLRGFLQALPWNAAWILGLGLFLGPGLHPGPGPHPGPGWMGRIQGPPVPFRPPVRHHPRFALMGFANLAVAVLLGWILAEKERAEALARESRRAASRAQARALQAQMDPHVLFNALGGLTELVREDPEAAERALVSLADLLRGLLDLGAQATVPLAQERALVERYLALESIRLGRRLRVDWSWDPSLEGKEVPPLVLQPLVENAIKHGIAPSREGGELHIALQGGADWLELGVSNTGLPLDAAAGEGVGLRNLRERLALLGLPPDAFRLAREGAWTRAALRLPRSGGPA